MDDPLETIQAELANVVHRVDRAELIGFAKDLSHADRVFVTGEGRSGLMAKAFAMRVMHLGLRVHVIGETTTPAAGSGDTLVAVSGSGTTATTVLRVEQAAAKGVRVLVITIDPATPICRLAARRLLIPAATKHRRPGEAATAQPLSSLFDQATHLVLDAVVLLLAALRSSDDATAAHANLE